MTGLHEAEDLYHILGLASNVSPEKIKEQFRFLAQAFHPDKHASPAHKARAGEMLRKITEAYRILSDPLQRAAYDRKRSMQATAFEEQGVFQRERAAAPCSEELQQAAWHLDVLELPRHRAAAVVVLHPLRAILRQVTALSLFR